jgi:hypothetical protein
MNTISDQAAIAQSAPDSGAVLLPHPVSIICEVEGRSDRSKRKFFITIRAFFRGLVDDSAYREISLHRETSIIFTANGPLIYQPGANNDVQNGPARSSRK